MTQTHLRRSLQALGTAGVLLTTVYAAGQESQPHKVIGFHGHSNQLGDNPTTWTDNDKADCGGEYPFMTGIAINDDRRWSNLALCAQANGFVQGDGVKRTAKRVLGPSDLWGAPPLGAWDQVFECDDDEALVGVSQIREDRGFAGLDGVRCAQTSRLATDCSPVQFAFSDASEDEPYDWDLGNLSGTCGKGRYIKGLGTSVFTEVPSGYFLGATTNGMPITTILCCSFGDPAPDFVW